MYALAVQPDGRIVAVGEAFTGGQRVAIARLMIDNSTVVTRNYEGLWWASPAGSESGWGINFAHQGDVIFATWFTYDANGKAWWLAMTANRNTDGSYSGALFQTQGSAAVQRGPVRFHEGRCHAGGNGRDRLRHRFHRHVQLHGERRHAIEADHARSLRSDAGVRVRERLEPRLRLQLHRSLVELARRIRIGLGDQPHPGGHDDLRHVVHVQRRRLAALALGDRDTGGRLELPPGPSTSRAVPRSPPRRSILPRWPPRR